MEDNYKDHEYDLTEPGEPEEEKRTRYFTRSVSNTVMGGVCGGIGEYINIGPNFLRLVFVLATFAGGWGIITYITALLLMPIKPDANEYLEEEIAEIKKADQKTILGTTMILSGIYFIIAPTGLFHLFKFFGGSSEFTLTILFIAAGINLLKHAKNFHEQDKINIISELYRSKKEKRFMGVCGGLSEYLRIDSTLLRVIGVVSILLTAGISIIIYFVFSFLIPYEPGLTSYDDK